MSIALIAKDEIPVVLIGNLIARQGAGPLSAVSMHEILNEGKTVDQADLIFLISTTQEFLSAGEAVSQIHRNLSDRQELVLCMPCPHGTQRYQLLNFGAHEIISPAGSTPDHIYERILGHLILKRRIVPYDCGKVLGATSRMQEVYEQVSQYAPLGLPVLLRGETGTGKGLVAEQLHEKSGRTGAFVHFNCMAFNPGTFEDELFGHLKGAHSTAYSNRTGLIEEAQEGTVFIDEIGDFDLGLQGKLLDVIENNRVRPLGFNKYKEVDVRFIFATNCNLERLMAEGRFREDLFARMDVLSLRLPPLRQRKADIPLLVEHFVGVFNNKYKKKVKLAGGAVDELFRHEWRLNVRGLSSAVFKAAAGKGADGTITHFILSDGDREPARQQPHDGGESPHAGLIEINPGVDSWHALLNRVEEAYFRSLVAMSTSTEQAINLSDMGKTRLFEILRKYNLHIGNKPSQATRTKGDAASPPDQEM